MWGGVWCVHVSCLCSGSSFSSSLYRLGTVPVSAPRSASARSHLDSNLNICCPLVTFFLNAVAAMCFHTLWLFHLLFPPFSQLHFGYPHLWYGLATNDLSAISKNLSTVASILMETALKSLHFVATYFYTRCPYHLPLFPSVQFVFRYPHYVRSGNNLVTADISFGMRKMQKINFKSCRQCVVYC